MMIRHGIKQADKQRLLFYICRYDFLAPNEDALPEKFRGRNLEDAKENLIIDKGKYRARRSHITLKRQRKTQIIFFSV